MSCGHEVKGLPPLLLLVTVTLLKIETVHARARHSLDLAIQSPRGLDLGNMPRYGKSWGKNSRDDLTVAKVLSFRLDPISDHLRQAQHIASG